MASTTRRRWFQFGLAGYLTWVIPYFAMLTGVLAWRYEEPENGDFLGLGRAIFGGARLYFAILVTILWSFAFLVTKLIGLWLRRRDARDAATRAFGGPCVRSRRVLEMRHVIMLAASVAIGLALVYVAMRLFTQPAPDESPYYYPDIAVIVFVIGLAVIGSGLGIALDGATLAVLLALTLPILTCLAIFTAFWSTIGLLSLFPYLAW